MSMVTRTVMGIITIMIEAMALSRLLQLASPMLPVGAYAYSQGLEAAIEGGTVSDAAGARAWIDDVLTLYLARFELPVLHRLHDTWRDGGDAAEWNTMFRAGRDIGEARAETLQMGYSLVSLLRDLDSFAANDLDRLGAMAPVTYPLAYAFATAHWGIPAETALHAYAWSWLENQVAVAMKTIPIGQVAGQRILMAVGGNLHAHVEQAMARPDEILSNFAPGLTLAACRHETQYSRLFRS
jgi:urease accessory protein